MTRLARPGEVNYALVDQWTLAHAAIGVLLGSQGLSPRQALVVGAAWEIAERPLKDAFPAMFPSETQDSLRNAVGDALAMAAGAWLFQYVTPS
jgi:hypothetical protein